MARFNVTVMLEVEAEDEHDAWSKVEYAVDNLTTGDILQTWTTDIDEVVSE